MQFYNICLQRGCGETFSGCYFKSLIAINNDHSNGFNSKIVITVMQRPFLKKEPLTFVKKITVWLIGVNEKYSVGKLIRNIWQYLNCTFKYSRDLSLD